MAWPTIPQAQFSPWPSMPTQSMSVQLAGMPFLPFGLPHFDQQPQGGGPMTLPPSGQFTSGSVSGRLLPPSFTGYNQQPSYGGGGGGGGGGRGYYSQPNSQEPQPTPAQYGPPTPNSQGPSVSSGGQMWDPSQGYGGTGVSYPWFGSNGDSQGGVKTWNGGIEKPPGPMTSMTPFDSNGNPIQPFGDSGGVQLPGTINYGYGPAPTSSSAPTSYPANPYTGSTEYPPPPFGYGNYYNPLGDIQQPTQQYGPPAPNGPYVYSPNPYNAALGPGGDSIGPPGSIFGPNPVTSEFNSAYGFGDNGGE